MRELTSVYYKDKNEGCVKEVVECYQGCDGTPFTLVRQEELPFVQAQEILAPMFVDTTESRHRPLGGKVEEARILRHGQLWFRSLVPVSAGLVIRFGRNGAEYHIKHRRYVLPKGGYGYIIERTDGSEPLENDLRIIRTNKFKVVRKF